MGDISIPYKFQPRPYQMNFWMAMEGDGGGELAKKRAVLNWHRRSGKDKTSVNFMIKQMMKRVGSYYYFLPTIAQGRKVIWNQIGKDGFRFLDHFPKELIYKKLENVMQITMRHPENYNEPGSMFQLVGSDRFDSSMGSNAVGMIFSEFALQDPRAWDFFRPILMENDGWAIFISTPRGKNHFHKLFNIAAERPEHWFSETLTVRDTHDNDDTRILTDEQIQSEREDGMSEELIEQEFYCSFSGEQEGSYYSDVMKRARADNRISNNWIYDVNEPVFTTWDLGINDTTAIWFFQFLGNRIVFIDYEEGVGEPIAYYLKKLEDKRVDLGYKYAQNLLPHDSVKQELTSGTSVYQMVQKYGFDATKIKRTSNKMDGINQVRSLFHRFCFNSMMCRKGLDALSEYHKKYLHKQKTFANYPDHNWSSNACDAIRILAEGQNQIRGFNSGGHAVMSESDCDLMYEQYGPTIHYDI